MKNSLIVADLQEIPMYGGFSPPSGGVESSPEQFAKFASSVFGMLTLVAGLSFLLYFVLGAISWITSSGDAKKVEDAKNQMTSAAIGLIVVVAAYAIAAVVGAVLGFNLLLDNPKDTIDQLAPGGGS